jgi:hypothetical protein
MVHRPYSCHSNEHEESNCCKECKNYYCVTKKECDWIKHRVCENWLHESCTIFSSACKNYGGKNYSNPEKHNKSTKK